MEVRRGWARQMARGLLKKYCIQDPGTPIGDIVRCEGLEIHFMDWGEDISGLLVKQNDAVIVGLNKNHARTRQRFTLAHEFGHYVLMHDQLESVPASIDHPPDPSQLFPQNAEQEANEFAGEILVPMRILKTVHKQEGNPRKLASLFEVSEAVIFIALSKHGLLK